MNPDLLKRYEDGTLKEYEPVAEGDRVLQGDCWQTPSGSRFLVLGLIGHIYRKKPGQTSIIVRHKTSK